MFRHSSLKAPSSGTKEYEGKKTDGGFPCPFTTGSGAQGNVWSCLAFDQMLAYLYYFWHSSHSENEA